MPSDIPADATAATNPAPIICSRTGRIIEPHETAFVVDGQVVCREVHDELRPTCPYCHHALPGRPAPYSPCPHCHETILVRTNQDLFDSTFLTREQSEELDRMEAIIRPFKPFNLRVRDYLNMKDKLRTEMELDRDATPAEIIWQLFHEAAKRLTPGSAPGNAPGIAPGIAPGSRGLRSSEAPDAETSATSATSGGGATGGTLADLYLLQARFVHAQGKDHRPFQYKWARTVLADLKAAGATHVRLVGLPNDCLPSRRLHGQVIPIDHAIAHPPLPCGDCNHKLITDEMTFRGETYQTLRPQQAHTTLRQAVADRPFCECTYLPTDAAGNPVAGYNSSDTAGGGSDPGADLLAGF